MRSELNRETPVAERGEFPPLRLGALAVDPPVVLAPMAGVTNAPFRTLCRRFSEQRCLYVSEMIVARSFVMGHRKTLRLASFGPDEEAGGGVKSIQLYGTDPGSLAVATRVLVSEWGVHHIDLNFGCPVRKVTAAGGGSAIPLRPRLMARLVRAVVRGARHASVPVTVKFRKGIDDGLLTFLDAGRVAAAEGAAAVGLHARTAAQLYSGEADWGSIAELKSAVEVPVLGNGDVFEAFDALRMIRQTGCDGVIVGRGCLGRPWLFRDLVDVFDGREPKEPPTLGEVCDIAIRHARLLVEFFGERAAILQMRKHLSWYTKSFPGMGRVRPALMQVGTVAELEEALSGLPRDLVFPPAGLRVKRGKDSRAQKVSLPPGFLERREDDRAVFGDPTGMDPALSGG